MTERMNSREEGNVYYVVRESIEQLLQTWQNLVTKGSTNKEARLSAFTMSTYIKELAGMQELGTNRILLPACFEMYASCVESILDECFDDKLTGKTIRITTLLTKPLRRWYNISTEICGEFRCELTRSRWEGYKRSMAKLVIGEDKTHNIQVRRIVTSEEFFGDGEELFVYSTDDGRAMTVANAPMIKPPECIELLNDVKNTLEHGDGRWLVHLIGKHKDGVDKTLCDHNRWLSITEHFHKQYHNNRHKSGETIKPNQKGVYFCCVPKDDLDVEYNDMFIVDMSALQEGIFAVAFNVDQQRQISGIVFTEEDAKRELEKLDTIWDYAGKTQG